MKKLYTHLIAISALTACSAAFANSTATGTISASVPTTAVITTINSSDLNYGSLTQTQLQSPITKQTNLSVYSNTQTAEDLCLSATYGKFSSTEQLPYLSPGSTDLTPIYLEAVNYRTCGGAAAHTYTGIGSSASTFTTLSSGNGGTTEAECTANPGQLSVTTKPLAAGAEPRVGGDYTETIELGVAPAGC